MNIEEKQARLKQLLSEPFLSDQDLDEMYQLKEELELPQKEECNCKEYNKLKDCTCESKEEIKTIKKQKRSLYEILREKLKTKPATWDEIQQLKLERAKAYLKRDISLAKQQTKSRFSNIGNTLTFLSNTPEQNQSRRSKKEKSSKNNKDIRESLFTKTKITNNQTPSFSQPSQKDFLKKWRMKDTREYKL